MAGAIIKVRDNEDGTLDMDVEFSETVNNQSNAHKLVARFIEFANTPETEAEVKKD